MHMTTRRAIALCTLDRLLGSVESDPQAFLAAAHELIMEADEDRLLGTPGMVAHYVRRAGEVPVNSREGAMIRVAACVGYLLGVAQIRGVQ